jgi:hypothetical protein
MLDWSDRTVMYWLTREMPLDMTFLWESSQLRWLIIYAQKSAIPKQWDPLHFEGIFKAQRHRDGSTFLNEMQATKITILPR